jgi:hypothetical protein
MLESSSIAGLRPCQVRDSVGSLRTGNCSRLVGDLESGPVTYDSIASTIQACIVVVIMNAHVQVVFGLPRLEAIPVDLVACW